MNKKEFDFWFEDYKYLAEAFAKGDLNWHEKEWKDFIKLIRTETLQAIKDKMPKEYTKDYCPISKIEFEIQGLEFIQGKVEGNNQYRSQMLEIIEKLNK